MRLSLDHSVLLISWNVDVRFSQNGFWRNFWSRLGGHSWSEIGSVYFPAWKTDRTWCFACSMLGWEHGINYHETSCSYDCDPVWSTTDRDWGRIIPVVVSSGGDDPATGRQGHIRNTFSLVDHHFVVVLPGRGVLHLHHGVTGQHAHCLLKLTRITRTPPRLTGQTQLTLWVMVVCLLDTCYVVLCCVVRLVLIVVLPQCAVWLCWPTNTDWATLACTLHTCSHQHWPGLARFSNIIYLLINKVSQILYFLLE